MRRYILVAILILAFLVRFVGISSYPIGFTQDEAGIGYDAYSLLLTGKDQWGETWPLVLRSFGDFKLPLYSYLAIPSIALFGLNEFAVRLPAVVFGTLAVCATYLFVSQLSKRKDLAIFSALFLALSPWHISLSRGAFEANLTTFFIPLGIWGFLKGIKEPKWMVVAALSFGLNLYSYHSARYFTPIIILILLIGSWKTIRKEIGDTKLFKNIVVRYKWSIFLFGVFMLGVFLTTFTGAGKRGLDITIFNPTDQWQAVSDKRYTAVLQGMPDQIARLFSNKAIYVFDTFTNNYLSYFSTKFLFTSGASEWSYGMIADRGVLYFFEIIFIIIALYSFVKKKSIKGIAFIVFWIILAPIPAALTKGLGRSGTRAAVMMPAMQIFSAYGVVCAHQMLKEKSNIVKKGFTCLFALTLLFSATSFVEDYFYHTPQKAARNMSYGTKEAVLAVNKIASNYDLILISRTLSVPQIWVSFFNKLDPRLVQEASPDWLAYEEEGLLYLDQYDKYRLGKYQFGNLFYEKRKNIPRILFVGKPEEFPDDVNPIKTIYYPDGGVAYYIVDPVKNYYAEAN